MINHIKNLFKSKPSLIHFAKELQEEFGAGVAHGKELCLKEEQRKKNFIRDLTLYTLVIVVSGDWSNPIVGTHTYNESLKENNEDSLRVPVVIDLITEKKIHVLGRIIPFTFESLEALMSMKPDVRWAILTNMDHIPNFRNKDKQLQSYTDFEKAIRESRIFKQYQRIDDSDILDLQSEKKSVL